MTSSELPSLKIGTGWTEIEVISEPDVVLGYKGYAPVLRVKAIKTGLDYLLYIGAKSLAEPLESLRTSRGSGRGFLGLRMQIRKQSTEKFSRYEVQNA